MVEVIEEERGLTNAATDIVFAGAGAGVGVYVASKVGRIIEDALVTPVTQSSSSTSKFIAWVVNNAPKAIGAYAVDHYKPPGLTGNSARIVDGLTYGIAGDIAIDTYERLINKRAQAIPTVGDQYAESRIQALLNENVSLKQAIASLNHQLEAANSVQTNQEVPYREPLIPYQEMETAPYVEAATIPTNIRRSDGEIHDSEDTYHFANPEVPSPTERKYRFASDEIVKPEVLVTEFGFTRGE